MFSAVKLMTRRPPVARTAVTVVPRVWAAFYSESAAAADALPQGVGADGTPGERAIYSKLAAALTPARLNVRDVSGGCGAMYAVEVASERFRGAPLVRQHRMVIDAIQGEVKAAHG
ncbi:hypothetical protein HK405_001487, partial [Cladochytrium tenue]